MDGFTEKKWFVYLGDHHEGPFSLEDIQARMSHGQLSATNYVWADGMPDWQLMSELQAFESILLPAMPPPPPMQKASVAALSSGPELAPALASVGPTSGFSAVSLEPVAPPVAEPLETLQEAFTPPVAEPVGPILTAENSSSEPDLESQVTPDGDTSPNLLAQPQHKKALFGSLLKMALLLGFFGAIGIAYVDGYLAPFLNSRTVQSWTDSAMNLAEPALEAIGFSPIPKLNDVEPKDYQALKAAALTSRSSGARIAVAVSNGNLLTPTFYVASNLPNGAILEIYLEGIPGTLLDQLSFNASTQVTITKNFGKTSSFQYPPGVRAFARGRYTMYVVDPLTQPPDAKAMLDRMSQLQPSTPPLSVPKGLRIIAEKTVFLGGLPDSVYAQRLQEFHQKIMTKAKSELMELQQFASTFEAKLDETNKKFQYLTRRKRLNLAERKLWKQYDTQWTAFFQQMNQTFSKLTPDVLKNDYFYGPLYQMGQSTENTLNQLHGLQNTLFTTRVDRKAFDAQLAQATSSTQNAIESFKNKVDQIAQLPPTPNGLPNRAGM